MLLTFEQPTSKGLLTFLQQEDLVSRGLAVAKTNGNLRTYKYHRKVMYDYLWKKYPELLECRGHTYDITDGKLVIAAPTKTFNYLEDGHWSNVPLDTEVTLYKKFNGFMATMSMYKGEIVIGTTGTTNSNYSKMARETIFHNWHEEIAKYSIRDCDGTFLYEICHSNDPHIVQEKLGAHYLGCRMRETGEFFPAASIMTQDSWYHCTLAKALEIVQNDKGEGFMMYDEEGNCTKLKTPYYIGKKKLMRLKSSAISQMFNSKLDNLPDIWIPVAKHLITEYSEHYWANLPEQERRLKLELIWSNIYG